MQNMIYITFDPFSSGTTLVAHVYTVKVLKTYNYLVYLYAYLPTPLGHVLTCKSAWHSFLVVTAEDLH
jgi:hypothetical protein